MARNRTQISAEFDTPILRRGSLPRLVRQLHNSALCGRENVAFIARVYGAGLAPTIRFVEEFSELGEYFRYYGASDQKVL